MWDMQHAAKLPINGAPVRKQPSKRSLLWEQLLHGVLTNYAPCILGRPSTATAPAVWAQSLLNCGPRPKATYDPLGGGPKARPPFGGRAEGPPPCWGGRAEGPPPRWGRN